MSRFPILDDDVAQAKADVETQANADADQTEFLKRYPKAVVVNGKPNAITEMDALVAYLQVLGTMVDFADTAQEKLKQ